MILQMRDGTTQVIVGENPCLDLVYRDGRPYVVMKEGEADGGERAGDEQDQADTDSGR